MATQQTQHTEPPQSSASITTQQLTVIHKENNNPPKINNNLLRKSKLTEKQNVEGGFCMAWIGIYDPFCFECMSVSVRAGFLPPDCVRQWGQLVVIYLQCCQFLQHSYTKCKHTQTYTHRHTNASTQSNSDLRRNTHWALKPETFSFNIINHKSWLQTLHIHLSFVFSFHFHS